MEIFGKICAFLAALTLTFGSLEALRPSLEPPSLLENKGAFFSERTDDAEFIFADEYRLPVEVTPTYYVIKVAPQVYDAQAEDFLTGMGNVVITATAKFSNASTITLNVDSNFINITENGVQVRQKGGNALVVTRLVQDQPRTFFTIQLAANLSQGQEYEVEIPYVVKLSDTTKGGGTTGIFGAAYTDPATNETRYMAATQFEPARARRAFPSFDEPELKAQFEVQIGRKDPYKSLSNMVLKETTPGENGWMWDIYNPTQNQSSYLVCFAVSDFVSVDAPEGLYGKPVKIWAAKYLIDQSGGVFAAQAAAKVLQYFNTTFGLDYKYPKMDSIAVPPFGGAMENWGLNVYGEGALLYIPGKSNENNKRSISNVIAHELAHQWFGNLVTCKWWSDIWLNEGFATFMSFQAENAVTPELEPLERIYLDVIPAAMGYDHGPSTHPVKPVVDNPVNGTKFTTMVYEKGAALIRMMDGAFGRERFYKGIVEYLNEMSYKGAEQDDLFRNLQANVGETLPANLTVKDFMETWTLQTGYPVVRVSRINGDTLYISQERYFAEPNQKATELTTWNVPLSISTEQNVTAIIPEWIRKDQLTKPLTGINTNQWILVNTDGTGYYRVLYDENLVKPLWDQLNKDHSVFSSTTRAMFLNDYFNLASAEYTNVEEAFEFTRYLGKETKRVPWSIFLIHFAKFAQLAEDSPYAKSIILRYLGPRFDGLFANIGLKQEENDNGHPVILRNAVLERACPLRYSGCLSYGDEMYQQWKSSTTNPTPIDLKTVLYCGAVAGPNGSDAFDFFLEEYMKEIDSNHKAQLINALPCSKLESEHQRLLELAEDPSSGLVSSHRVEILRRMVQESTGRGLTLAYIKANLNGTFVTPQIYADVISSLSNYVYRDVHATDIENYLKANEEILKDITPSIQASLSRIRANGEWMHKLGNPAITWMGSNLN